VLPPTPVIVDHVTSGVIFPLHIIGARGSSIAPGVGRFQVAKLEDATMRREVFKVRPELPSGAIAYVATRVAGAPLPRRSSMLSTMAIDIMKLGMAAPYDVVSPRAMARITQLTALPAQSEGVSHDRLRGGIEIAMGMSYPASLWVFRLEGVEANASDHEFLSHLSPSATREESLKWQLNEASPRWVLQPYDLRPAAPELDRLATLE